MKRILLFLLTNIAVIAVAMITFSIIGFTGYFDGAQINVVNVFIFALVIGFAGSGISLLLSKWMAKKTMGVGLIKDQSDDLNRLFFVKHTTERLAKQAGLKSVEVGVFQSPEPNAFATGAFKNNALVAVSTGLVDSMSPEEVEAVLAHEIAHVKNGDMVTMALLQGVINTFVIAISRILSNFVDRVILKNEDGPGVAFFIISIVMELILGFLAMFITMAYSRHREFAADKLAADMVGPKKMISALEALDRNSPQSLPDSMAAFGIFGRNGLLSSHPPISKRIQALQTHPHFYNQ